MKVDGNRPEPVANGAGSSAAQAAQAAERLQQQKLEQQRPNDAKNDKVVLSADARLADNAVRAASKVPEVRQDVVERVRAKLDAGELGKDLNRLADRMIDSLLSR
jgi:flagellar biosynthesis anti-sigma factor FlgM